MLRQKFRYDKYEALLEQGEYGGAQKYCASFPQDKNAVICDLYAQYRLLKAQTDIDTSFSALEVASKDIYQSVMSTRGQIGYEKGALYFLGVVPFERGFIAEGSDVLTIAASLQKKKVSDMEQKARVYLEQYWLQQWEKNHKIEDLKQAADCFGHSETCYLYADRLREEGRDRDTANLYEFTYAIEYCAIQMERDTYHRTISHDIRKNIGFLTSDMAIVKESLGGIESHLVIMLQKVNELPEAICHTLHQEFQGFRTQMVKLSEKTEQREEMLYALVEKAQTLDLELQRNQDTILELKTLAEQIRIAEQDREDRLTQSVDTLKSVVLENENRLLQEIIQEAAAEIEGRFQDRLSKEARESVVTALFTLNFYKALSSTYEPLLEYSGVVMLAASALEIELRKRLYDPFTAYIQEEYGQKRKKTATLRSFIYEAGIWQGTMTKQKQEENYTRFRAFIQKYNNLYSTNAGSLFECGTDAAFHSQLELFARRLNELGNIRNKAAHINSVTLEEAEKACEWVFLTSQECANPVAEENISLLEWLLNSFTP